MSEPVRLKFFQLISQLKYLSCQGTFPFWIKFQEGIVIFFYKCLMKFLGKNYSNVYCAIMEYPKQKL